MIDFILGAVVLALAGGGWYFIRRSGVNAERDKATKARLDGIAEHKKTEKEVANADRDSIIDINTRP